MFLDYLIQEDRYDALFSQKNIHLHLQTKFLSVRYQHLHLETKFFFIMIWTLRTHIDHQSTIFKMQVAFGTNKYSVGICSLEIGEYLVLSVSLNKILSKQFWSRSWLDKYMFSPACYTWAEVRKLRQYPSSMDSLVLCVKSLSKILLNLT